MGENKKKREINPAVLSYKMAGQPLSYMKAVIGEAVPTASLSAYRTPTQGDPKKFPVKISNIALLFEKLFFEKKAAAFSFKKGSVYFEIYKTPYLCDENGVHIQEIPEKPEDVARSDIYAAWAYALFLTLSGVLKLKDLLREIKSNQARPETLGTFCDDFFSYNMNGKKKVTVCDDLNIEEIRAAFLTGGMKNMFPGLASEDTMLLMQEKKEEKPASRPESSFINGSKELYERIKRGEFFIPYEWSEEDRKNIEPLSYLDDFVPNEVYWKLFNKINFRFNRTITELKKIIGKTEGVLTPEEVEKIPYEKIAAILRKNSVEFTISGDPGTGKTAIITALSASLGIPLANTPLSQNTEEDFAQGKIIIKEDGQMVSVPTGVVNGVTRGWIVDFEEPNLTPTAVVFGAVGQAIEYPYTLLMYGYKPVRRHPLCVFCSTTNVGTAGTKEQNQAFRNRMLSSYDLREAKKAEMVETLVVRTGIKKYICSYVYDIYYAIVQELKNPKNASKFGAADTDSIVLSLSRRSCIGALRNIEEGCYPKEAIYDSIIGKIAEENREVADMMRIAVEGMRNLVIEGGLYEDES